MPINKYAADKEYELPEYKKISAEMLKIFKATTKADLTILEGNNHYADGLGFSRFWEYPWAIINSKVSKDMKVLDVGCGRAPFLPYLGKVIGCKAHGVDYDGSGCVEDGLWGCDEGFNAEYNFTVKKADAREHIPFPGNHFDRVFCISTIEHMSTGDEVRRAVKEMVRVLKPSGLLVITVDEGLYRNEIEESAGLPYYGYCDFSKLKIKKPYSVLGMIFVKAGKEKEVATMPKQDIIGIGPSATISSLPPQPPSEVEEKKEEAEEGVDLPFEPEMENSEETEKDVEDIIQKEKEEELGVSPTLPSEYKGKKEGITFREIAEKIKDKLRRK